MTEDKLSKNIYYKRERGVADVLEGFLKPVFEKQGYALTKILFKWHSIISNDEVSSYSKPIKIVSHKTYSGVNQVLTIECDNPYIAQKIAYMKDIIIERVKVYLNYAAISDVRTTLVPRSINKPRDIKFSEIPVTDEQKVMLNQISSCDDEIIENSLKSLGTSILKRDNLKKLRKGVRL